MIPGEIKDDFLDWLALPMTQSAKHYIMRLKSETEFNMGDGGTLNFDNPGATQGKTAHSVGIVTGYNTVINQVFPNILTEPDNINKPEGE